MSDTSEEVLQVRYEDAVAVMTMNNPPRLNAFSWAMRSQMYERLLEIEGNADCRAIVLTGAGGSFCAGGDISEMAHRQVLEARMRTDLAARIFKLLVAGPKPFLCAVEGNAAGAGISFVAASDYAVAASDAKFTSSFIKVGLLPDVGAIWSLPRKVGHRKAMELCAFAESIDAQEALRIQLINRTCEPGHALTEALAVAQKFARNPPVAMALLRSALNTANDTVDRAVTAETDYQSVLMNTEDYTEAAKAFMEKRRPQFKGR